MVIGLLVPVAWAPALVLTMYPLMTPVGAVKLTVTDEPVVAVTAKLVGVFGTGLVVTAVDGSDAADVPAVFVAVTVNVYAVLAFSPFTVIGLVVPVVTTFPGLLVTVYWVITPPPLGAVNPTLTIESFKTVPVTEVGAEGTVVTVNVPLGEVPALLIAAKFKV